MIVGEYEVVQTKTSVKIIKDGKAVYMRPKRKELTSKELIGELNKYKDMMMIGE